MTTKPKTRGVTSVNAPVIADQLGYSIPQFVTLTSIGRSTLYKAIKAGSLKVRKCHGRVLILRADALAFLDSLPVGE